MLDFMRTHIVSLILSMIGVGGIAFTIMQALKRNFDGVDASSAWTKRLSVAGIALLLAIASTFAGLPVPCDVSATVGVVARCLAGIDQGTIEKLITALVIAAGGAVSAYTAHAGKDSTS